MGQKLFSKCYSEFLIDVIRLEFRKLFNWDSSVGVFLSIFQNSVKKPLFTENFRTTASGIFSFTRLFLTPSELVETRFFLFFEHVISRLSNVMNVMSFAFEEIYLEKSTAKLLSDGNTHFTEKPREIKGWLLGWLTNYHSYTYTYWISVLHNPVILHLEVT